MGWFQASCLKISKFFSTFQLTHAKFQFQKYETEFIVSYKNQIESILKISWEKLGKETWSLCQAASMSDPPPWKKQHLVLNPCWWLWGDSIVWGLQENATQNCLSLNLQSFLKNIFKRQSQLSSRAKEKLFRGQVKQKVEGHQHHSSHNTSTTTAGREKKWNKKG